MTAGKLIIISGFSGVGKGTVIRQLMNDHPGKYVFSVSATSRAPRPGELDGREYYFVTRDIFIEMIRQQRLLEYNEYNHNYYGTPAEPIDRHLAGGMNIILDIDINGMHQVTALRNDVIKIFIIPPSAGELIRRLTGRGTETKEQIRSRLMTALSEGAGAGEYDYILTNFDFCETSELINDIADGRPIDYDRNAQTALTAAICEEIQNLL